MCKDMNVALVRIRMLDKICKHVLTACICYRNVVRIGLDVSINHINVFVAAITAICNLWSLAGYDDQGKTIQLKYNETGHIHKKK